MSARSIEPARAGSRRALLVAAAAGAAALTAESLARPIGANADDGDPLVLGQGNVAASQTSLTSPASPGLSVTGGQTGLVVAGDEHGLMAASQGGGSGWPRAIIANGNEGSTGLHAASWAPGGGPGYGDADAIVGETGGGKAVVAHAFGSGMGLDAESGSGLGARIRSGTGTGLVVESQSGPGVSVTSVGTGLSVDAQGWGVFVNSYHAGGNDPAAIIGNGKNNAPGVVGNSIADAGWNPNGSGTGVHGSSGTGTGVRGEATLEGGVGVAGRAEHGTGVQAISLDGIGLDAQGTESGIHVNAPRYGLIADCEGTESGAVAVLGHGFNNAVGVVGRCLAGTDFDVGGSDTGVSGDSGSGPGVSGTSSSGPGVAGSSDSMTGVLGSAGWVGVYGYSEHTGVVGAAHGMIEGVPVPTKVGVYGFAPLDSASRGVHGLAVAGRGVHGQATSGQGVRGDGTTGYGVRGYATSGTAGYFSTPKSGSTQLYTGYALRAIGRVKLDQCAGLATITAGASSVAVPLAIDLTSTSAAVATLQGSAGSAATTVSRVIVNTSTNTLTIYLTKAASQPVKVAWHVFG